MPLYIYGLDRRSSRTGAILSNVTGMTRRSYFSRLPEKFRVSDIESARRRRVSGVSSKENTHTLRCPLSLVQQHFFILYIPHRPFFFSSSYIYNILPPSYSCSSSRDILDRSIFLYPRSELLNVAAGVCVCVCAKKNDKNSCIGGKRGRGEVERIR